MPLSPLSDSVSLRLRDSYPLTSRHTATRRLILQKARRHGVASAPTACRSTVSGSLSLPSRGPFHLSLTVLCAIGSCRVFSLGGWSPLLPAGFLVSRRTQDHIPCSLPAFGYRAFTFSRRTSHSVRLTFCFLTARAHALNISYNPVHISTYGLGSSLFARRYWGNLS